MNTNQPADAGHH